MKGLFLLKAKNGLIMIIETARFVSNIHAFFEVEEAFKRTWFLLGFRAYIRACITIFRLRRPNGGPREAQRGPSRGSTGAQR